MLWSAWEERRNVMESEVIPLSCTITGAVRFYGPKRIPCTSLRLLKLNFAASFFGRTPLSRVTQLLLTQLPLLLFEHLGDGSFNLTGHRLRLSDSG